MATFLYFAYGSNMLKERLTAPKRCNSAKLVGVAKAQGSQLLFAKRSRDASGKAMITSTPGQTVFGGVYSIEKEELPALDRAEGKGSGYDRIENFSIELLASNRTEIATTYLASPSHIDTSLKPYGWYKALVIAGAHQLELPHDYVEMLDQFAHVDDPDANRQEFKEAIEVLAKAGITDYLLDSLNRNH